MPSARTKPFPVRCAIMTRRGLAEPRCPECGYWFEWADLRDPAKRLQASQVMVLQLLHWKVVLIAEGY
jgi:hypothetical protein